MAKRKRRKRNRKPKELVYDQPTGGGYDHGPSEGGRYFSRLATSIEHARKDLSIFRHRRRTAVQQYVGRNYSDENTLPRSPLNMIDLAVSTITRHLVGQAPRALARTKIPALKPAANEFGLALNEVIDELVLVDVIRDWVFNALFGLSIVKTGIAPEGEAEVEGQVHDVMGVFSVYVDLDDWVHDTTARCWPELQFMGNRHRVSYEFFKESGLYDKKAIADVAPAGREVANEGGDERIETLTYRQNTTNEPYTDWVEILDVWLPAEQIVVSMVDQDMLRPVREVEWTGPERGPFRPLIFKSVPRSVMPLPPVASLQDLHDIVNAVYRKSANQALRQKDVTVYAGGAHKDAERLRDASDGELVRTDFPDKVRTHKMGGVDQVGLAMAIDARGQFSYHAGNLDSLAGLSPQADTAQQDRMLKQSSSKQIDDMQDKVSTGVAGVLRDIGSYMWGDPLIDIPITVQLPGDDHQMQGRFRQKSKNGKFSNYAIDIVPYSLEYRSPGEILQAVQVFVQTVAIPSAPQMAAQGIGLDWGKLIKLWSHYANLPELEDILLPVALQESALGERPRQAAQTTRTNVRVSRPGGSQGGKDAAMMQNLLGSGAQPAENAALMRPTG